MKAVKSSQNEPRSGTNPHEEWFTAFIDRVNSSITADKKLLESGDAPQDKIDFYNSLIAGDMLKTLSTARESASQSLIGNIVVNYIAELQSRKIKVSQLAFDISTNKVLVWAEISDDDETTEMELISVESLINARFFAGTKIYLDSTIVEQSDNLEVPQHYRLYTLNR